MTKSAFVADVLAKMNEHPSDIAQSLNAFQRSAHVLSDTHPRLIDEYPNQWVAVTGNAVMAHGDTLEDVLSLVDAEGVSRSDVIVRFIERTQRTLIL